MQISCMVESVFSKALAACGAKTALLDINLDAAEKYASEIRAEGGQAKAYRCNVLEREGIEQAYRQMLEEFGPCDILINGAGGNNPRATTTNEYYLEGDLDHPDRKTFFNLAPEDVSSVFNLNFLGTLLPTQVFAADMARRGSGCIVNISSMNAYIPLTKIPAYSGAKAAISNFTQWMATHFSKAGIRVNAIAPGFFVTIQNEKMLFNDDGTPTPRTGRILAGTPMGRFGKAEELLGALQFLINEKASSFVTGIVIPVDGGYSAFSGV